MGTVATFQIIYAGGGIDNPAATEAIAGFLAAMRADQAVFTTYDETSAIRKIARGELSISQAPPEVREVEQACRLAKTATQGRFDAWWKGWFDPTGYVKGWSTERAFHQHLEPLIYDQLPSQGAGSDSDDASQNENASSGAGAAFGPPAQIAAVGVNVGGDMQLATRPGSEWVWQVGIASPFDKHRMLAKFSLQDGAVATSGPGERGEHIFDPKTGKPAATLDGSEVPAALQGSTSGTVTPAVIGTTAPDQGQSENRNMVASATVIADNLAMADLWATTAVVAGFDDLGWVKDAGTRSGMLVANDGRVRRWAGPVVLPS